MLHSLNLFLLRLLLGLLRPSRSSCFLVSSQQKGSWLVKRDFRVEILSDPIAYKVTNLSESLLSCSFLSDLFFEVSWCYLERILALSPADHSRSQIWDKRWKRETHAQNVRQEEDDRRMWVNNWMKWASSQLDTREHFMHIDLSFIQQSPRSFKPSLCSSFRVALT